MSDDQDNKQSDEKTQSDVSEDINIFDEATRIAPSSSFIAPATPSIAASVSPKASPLPIRAAAAPIVSVSPLPEPPVWPPQSKSQSPQAPIAVSPTKPVISHPVSSFEDKTMVGQLIIEPTASNDTAAEETNTTEPNQEIEEEYQPSRFNRNKIAVGAIVAVLVVSIIYVFFGSKSSKVAPQKPLIAETTNVINEFNEQQEVVKAQMGQPVQNAVPVTQQVAVAKPIQPVMANPSAQIPNQNRLPANQQTVQHQTSNQFFGRFKAVTDKNQHFGRDPSSP